MHVEPREEDPIINMVLRSDTIEGNEGWDRCDTPMKEQRAFLMFSSVMPCASHKDFIIN